MLHNDVHQPTVGTDALVQALLEEVEGQPLMAYVEQVVNTAFCKDPVDPAFGRKTCCMPVAIMPEGQRYTQCPEHLDPGARVVWDAAWHEFIMKNKVVIS